MKNPTWGQRVAERRRSLDLNQSQLASLAGIGQPAVSKIERDAVAVPDATKARIARALGCRIATLFPYEDEVAA
jgi:transcriptional regulator with XRE-family HTH domain